jgi:hypothetical protein
MTIFQNFLHHIPKKLKDRHFGPSKFLKTLFFPNVPPLHLRWSLLEEVVLEAKEKADKVKDNPHPLEFLPR